MMLAAGDYNARSYRVISSRPRRRYENAANIKACMKRRAKNKQANKSRQRNRNVSK